MRELVDRVRVDDGIEIDLRCSQLHVASSLHSSADQFRRAVLAYSGKLDIAEFGLDVVTIDENSTVITSERYVDLLWQFGSGSINSRCPHLQGQYQALT